MMARSYKRMPVSSNAAVRAGDEKAYKAMAHRAERAAVRVILSFDPEAELLPHPLAFGNPWGAPKDGKHWWPRETPADLRK